MIDPKTFEEWAHSTYMGRPSFEEHLRSAWNAGRQSADAELVEALKYAESELTYDSKHGLNAEGERRTVDTALYMVRKALTKHGEPK